MNTMNRNKLIVASLIGVVAALGGCRHDDTQEDVGERAPVVRQETGAPIIIQSETMPPLRVEEHGPPPRTTDVWVSGHWEKTDRGWLWNSGHWEQRG